MFNRTLAKRFRRLPEGTTRDVWLAGLEVLRQALINGHGITLEGIGAVVPRTRAATRSYHPGSRRVQLIPERRSLKVRLSPAFAADFAKAVEEEKS